MNKNYEKTLIVGRGLSGQAAADLLEWSGADHKSDFYYFDDQASRSDFKSIEDLTKIAWERLIVSPGYPLKSPWIQKLLANGAKLYSEIDLAAQYLESETTIAITGSVGKSTTAALLNHLLIKGGRSSFLGGNYGVPLCRYVLESLKGQRKRSEFIVVELSSFQLENVKTHWQWGLYTAFYPNHLDRYDSLEHYYQTKWRLLDLVENKVIASALSGDLKTFSLRHQHEKLSIIDEAHPHATIKVLMKYLGVEIDDKDYQSFKGLPHRFEKIRSREGILFINDSKCTTLQGIRFALEEVKTQNLQKNGKLYLLIGGRDKSFDWKSLIKDVEKYSLKLCYFGELKENLLAINRNPYLKSDKLSFLLEELKSQLKREDVVLLSPGGVSYDEFKDFTARGDFFKNFVKMNFSCED